MLGILMKIENVINKIEDTIIVLVVASIVVDVFLQVVFRYVVHAPLSWTEELSRVLLIWLTFFGASLTIRNGGHFHLDILLKKLPSQFRSVVEILLACITIIFLSVLLWKSLTILPIVHRQISPSLRFPMSFIYVAIPLGSAFMLFHMIVMVYKKLYDMVTDRGINE